jgi:hypothetical protein
LLVEFDARHGVGLRRLPVFGQEVQGGTPGDAPEFLVVTAKMVGDARGVRWA